MYIYTEALKDVVEWYIQDSPRLDPRVTEYLRGPWITQMSKDEAFHIPLGFWNPWFFELDERH